MATHSSVLAWRIPETGSLVGCRLWGRTESGTASDLAAAWRATNRKQQEIQCQWHKAQFQMPEHEVR